MRDVGGEEGPVARAEVHAVTVDIEDGGAGQEGHPFVLGLDVGAGPVVGPAQDLLDDQLAAGQKPVDALAGGGRVGGRAEAALPGRRGQMSVSYSRTTVRGRRVR